MPITRLLIAGLLLVFLSQCGKTQDTRRPSVGSTARKDSIASAKRKTEQRARHMKTLDDVLAAVKRTEGASEGDRLIHAEYSVFKTLTVLVRTLDTSAIVRKEVALEEQRLLREDSTRVGAAGKITNGMLGIFSMYGLLYKMRFSERQDKIDTFSTIHENVVKTIRPDVMAIETVASMSNAIYEMSKMIVEDIDREGVYAQQFELIEQQYADGVKSAETDEDRFLNGLYRTFEIAQLWAHYLDPSGKADISKIQRELLSATKNAQDIATQLAIGMEFLYRIHDLVARRSVRLTN